MSKAKVPVRIVRPLVESVNLPVVISTHRQRRHPGRAEAKSARTTHV
ncbi:MAG: hypothetical protein Q9O62_08100 [Ardenticatenia bacterium]|nr:hypothetical protein [Ardenticatenia bacterium]